MNFIKKSLFFFCAVLCFLFSGCKKNNSAAAGSSGDEAEHSSSLPPAFTFYCGISSSTASVPLCYFYDKVVSEDDWLYSVSDYSSQQVMLSDLLKGKIQAAVFKLDDALEIYKKSLGAVKLLGLLQENNTCIITYNPDLAGAESFSGQTVFADKKNDFDLKLLNIIFQKEKISPACQFDFSISEVDLCSALVSGIAGNALLREPFSTITFNKSNSFNNAFCLKQYYSGYSDGKKIPEYVILVNSSFVNTNKAQVSFFELQLPKAIFWCSSEYMKASSLAVEHKIVPDRGLARKLCTSGIYFWMNDFEGRSHLESYLKLLEEELPDDGFYISTPASL